MFYLSIKKKDAPVLYFTFGSSYTLAPVNDCSRLLSKFDANFGSRRNSSIADFL